MLVAQAATVGVVRDFREGLGVRGRVERIALQAVTRRAMEEQDRRDDQLAIRIANAVGQMIGG